MSYTNGLDKPSDHFNTILYSGDASSTRNITGVGFRPDWVWIKRRNSTAPNVLYDVVRGDGKQIISDDNSAEASNSIYGYVSDFISDGFEVTGGSTNLARVNASSGTYVAWNWKAAGTAPSKTYTVKVVSDSGNKYRFDDFGTSAVTLELSEGGTFRFDQSDSSNSGHPLRFSTTSDGTHGSGSEYTTGVTTSGTPGSSGAYTEITVAASAPTLYYYCSVHSGMGGQANTPTTNSFSNFDGSIQTNISPNITAGFSIVRWTGTGSAATIGHGLGSAPEYIVIKRTDSAGSWYVHHKGVDTSAPEDYFLQWHSTGARTNNTTVFNDTLPTSTVFTTGTVVGSGQTFIAYCFTNIKGFSRMSSYIGNGNSNGTFVYTGFRPIYVLIKRSSASGNSWRIYDSKRDTDNEMDNALFITTAVEGNYDAIDFLSNGFKLRGTSAAINGSGSTYIFYAIAEHPLVTSTAIPVTGK